MVSNRALECGELDETTLDPLAQSGAELEANMLGHNGPGYSDSRRSHTDFFSDRDTKTRVVSNCSLECDELDGVNLDPLPLSGGELEANMLARIRLAGVTVVGHTPTFSLIEIRSRDWSQIVR